MLHAVNDVRVCGECAANQDKMHALDPGECSAMGYVVRV